MEVQKYLHASPKLKPNGKKRFKRKIHSNSDTYQPPVKPSKKNFYRRAKDRSLNNNNSTVYTSFNDISKKSVTERKGSVQPIK